MTTQDEQEQRLEDELAICISFAIGCQPRRISYPVGGGRFFIRFGQVPYRRSLFDRIYFAWLA